MVNTLNTGTNVVEFMLVEESEKNPIVQLNIYKGETKDIDVFVDDATQFANTVLTSRSADVTVTTGADKFTITAVNAGNTYLDAVTTVDGVKFFGQLLVQGMEKVTATELETVITDVAAQGRTSRTAFGYAKGKFQDNEFFDSFDKAELFTKPVSEMIKEVTAKATS